MAQRRLDESNSGKLTLIQQALENLDKKHSDAEHDLVQMETDIRGMKDEIQKAEIDVQEAAQAEEQAKTEMDSIEGQMRLLAEREKNKLAPFGSNMQRVLTEIDNKQWYGEKPVGPLGRYVKLRDLKWANLMRIQLGRIMCAFAITHAKDRDQLYGILNRTGKSVSSLRHGLWLIVDILLAVATPT